jgi:hypothetical protein
MTARKAGRSEGAVFLVADEDAEASDRMTGLFSPDHFYIPVRTGEEALRYFGGMRMAGALLSDALPFEVGGAGAVLDRLVEGGARVVVLTEEPEPVVAARWKERGAFACLSHPTKALRRLIPLREVLERLAVAFRDDLNRPSGGF